MKLSSFALRLLFWITLLLEVGMGLLILACAGLVATAILSPAGAVLPAWAARVFPSAGNPKDFIQNVGALAAILVPVFGGIFAFLKLLWRALHPEPKNPATGDQPIRSVSLQDLRDRLGKHGGRVGWVNRAATRTADLQTAERIVITGRMKSGKTREAVELIARAVENDLVSDRQILEPGSLFQMAPVNLTLALKQVDPRAPVLLFLDDFPFHFQPGELPRLDEILRGLKTCKTVYVVATARLDQLTPEHRTWLNTRQFREISLPDLTGEQKETLLSSALEVFGVQAGAETRRVMLDKNDGTPESTLIALRRLRELNLPDVSAEQAAQVAVESVRDSWVAIRRTIEQKTPAAKYLFKALAVLYSSRTSNTGAYTPVLLAFAEGLWKQERKVVPGRRGKLKAALVQLAQYDIVEKGSVVYAPDVAVEGQFTQNEARELLEHFLTDRRAIHPVFRVVTADYVKAMSYLILLGWVYFEEERYADTVRCFTEAIRLMPDFSFPYEIRSVALQMMDRYAESLEDVSRLIKLDPRTARHYERRARLLEIYFNDLPAAIDDMSRAIELAPEQYEYWKARADLYEAAGNQPAAIQDLNRATELVKRAGETKEGR